MPKSLKEIAVEIAKGDGALTPELVNVGGTLRPEQSNKWINLVVAKSPILGQVTVDRSSKLKKDVNVREFITGVLQRVPQGTDPSKYTSFSNVGKELDMKAAQLYSYLTFDYLRDNKDRPGLENEAAGYLAETYARDVTKLAFVGEYDDYTDGDAAKGVFSHLNKGWPRLLKEATGSHKIDIADYITSGTVAWTNYLNAIITAMPAIYKSDSCVLLMNTSDYEEYCYQVGNLTGAVSLLITGGIKNFLGYKIVVVPDMPARNVIFTPLANLVYGVNTTIEKYRELKGTKRVIDYTFDSAFDYQVAVDDAAVIGYDKKIPDITSTLTASGTVGTAFTYTPTGSNLSGATFTATGLPSGLTISATTGAITGTPAAGSNGSHSIAITATSASGLESDTVTLALTIAAA